MSHSGFTNAVKYSGSPVAVCQAARSLPNPPTGAGADVTGWENNSNGARGEFEFTLIAGATVAVAAGAMLVAEEVFDTFPEESAAVTATNGTETINYTAHGFQTGDGPVRLSGTLPAEISLTDEYYVIKTGANSLQLAASRADALAETEIVFTDDGADLVLHWVTGVKSLIVSITAVDTTALLETLTIVGHGLVTAQRVQLVGGDLPAPLAALTDYFVIVHDADKIALATTAENASAGTRIDLADAGSGDQELVHNEYGPTEATVYSLFHELNGGAAIDLTVDIAYRERIQHRPGVVAYHLVAEGDDFVPFSAYVRGLRRSE